MLRHILDREDSFVVSSNGFCVVVYYLTSAKMHSRLLFWTDPYSDEN